VNNVDVRDAENPVPDVDIDLSHLPEDQRAWRSGYWMKKEMCSVLVRRTMVIARIW
jgi:hypothetical protein